MKSAWNQFWFAPREAFALHAVRVLTGLMLLAWLLPLAGDVTNQFSGSGWFDLQALKEAGRLDVTRVPKPVRGWSVLYPVWSDPALLRGTYWGAVGVIALFTVGVATRITAPLTWLFVVSFTASPAYEDEVDPLLHAMTLYLAVGYLLMGLGSFKTLSWSKRILGGLAGSASDRSSAATVSLRLLQIHFAILLVTTGLTKLQVGEWWQGVPHWYNLYPPLTSTVAKARLAARDFNTFLGLLNVAAYATLAWQITFPLFAWREGWRRLLLLGGAVAGWLGLALLYRLPIFGPAFAITCLAFLSDREWAWTRRFFPRILAKKDTGEAPFHGPHARATAASLQTARER